MADPGPAQVIDQRSEITEGVPSPVVQLHLIRRQALPLSEQPMGVFRVAAAANDHGQAILMGQSGSEDFPLGVATQHKNHLGRRR